MAELTGPKIFLRFLWPCAKFRLVAKLISKAEYDRLESFVKSGEEPHPSLFRDLFPGPTDELERFAKERNSPMWARRTVSEFCLQFGNQEEGKFPVKVATVCSVVNSDEVQVFCGNRTFIVDNPFRIPLEIGDSALIRLQMVIGKDE